MGGVVTQGEEGKEDKLDSLEQLHKGLYTLWMYYLVSYLKAYPVSGNDKVLTRRSLLKAYLIVLTDTLSQGLTIC